MQLEHAIGHLKEACSAQLNSLAVQDTMRLEHLIGRLDVTSRDCRTLMPDGQPDQQARIKGLQAEMRVLEEELVDTEARHRLYQLLAERTRWTPACAP